MLREGKRYKITLMLFVMLAVFIIPQVCHAWPFTVTSGTPFEFDSQRGEYPGVCKIDDTHCLCAYGGPSYHGCAVVLTTDTVNGTITMGTIFEFDTSEGYCPALSKIDDTHYLCAYWAGPGRAVVLTVDPTDWTITMGTPFDFDTERGSYPVLSRMDDSHYLCVYSGPYGDDGFIGRSVVLIVDSADWTITKGTPLDFDQEAGTPFVLSEIDDTHYLCVEGSTSDSAQAAVLIVDQTDWSITMGTPFELDSEYGYTSPALSKINDTHYLSIFRNPIIPNAENWLVILTVDPSEWIVSMETTPVMLSDEFVSEYNILYRISNTHHLRVYDDKAIVMAVDSTDWTVSMEWEPCVVDTVVGEKPSLCPIDDENYLYAYSGSSIHGWSVIINVEGEPALSSLEGYVTGSDKEPISGAVVTITATGYYSFKDTSDTNGYYEISDLYAGIYDSVTCVKEGYNSVCVENFEIEEGQTNSLNFQMTAPNMEVSPLTLDEKLQPDETLTAYVTVSNNGNGALAFNVDIESVSKEDKVEFDVSSRESHQQCGDDCAPLMSDISGWYTPAHRPESKTNRLNEWYTYGDIESMGWITWATSERVTYFDPSDFSLAYPFAITKLSHWFYESTSYPWDDATFRFKIYADDGTTLLYESGDIEAESEVEITHDMTEPVNIQSGGFYFGVAPVSSSGYPSSVADDLYTGNNHSYYGSAGNWQLWSESPDKGEFVQSVYLTGAASPWITVDPTSDIVEAGDSTEVAVTLDATGLGYGTLKFAHLLFTPSPDVGEQIVNVFLTIPSSDYGYISGNVTLEQGPYSTGDVRDVLITAGSDTTHPGIDGFYRIYVPGGDYDVAVSLYGYESAIHEDVTVVAGEETTDIDFDLDCLLGGLSGYVTDFDSGNPVEGAKVAVLDSLFDMTDENGFYEIGDVLEGGNTVEIRHMDYWTSTFHDVEIVQDTCNTLNATLQPSTDLYPPRNLEATDTLEDGRIIINWSAPGTPTMIELSQHDGSPANAYYQDFWHGYGVVFDVDAYPDATLEMIDFRHSPWGVTGTWPYKIHVVDWETFTEITSTDYLYTTGDDIWEVEISLGSVHSVSGLVGVLIEPRGNETDDAYPCLDYDEALNGYSVVADLTDFSQYDAASGDFLIDLWIMTPTKEKCIPAKKIKIEDIAHHKARKEVYSSLESGEFITIHQSKSMQNCNRDFLGTYNFYRSSTPDITYGGLIAEEITDTVYIDSTVSPNEVWYYAATALYEPEDPNDPYDQSPFSNIDGGKWIEVGGDDEPAIWSTGLNANFPNPFNPDRTGTTISFSLKDRTRVNLSVYNIRGQLVATLFEDEMDAGSDYQIIWDGKSGSRNLANGIYFYKLETNNRSFIKKMILMR